MPPTLSSRKKTALFDIGLVMIVKDEAHIIEQALESVAGMIDTYAISDTGSSDGTPEIITEFFNKKGIPGFVFHDEWRDFGWNRTRVLEHARSRMRYALMMDADDLFYSKDAALTKTALVRLMNNEGADAYQVTIVNEDDTLQYYRTQLFYLKKPWRYEGVLHEFPRLDKQKKTPTSHQNKTPTTLLPFQIRSRRLGNRNKMDAVEKYKKDALVLKNALVHDPLNTRYMFYLAQSYRDAGMYEEAARWYKTRVDFGGWYEEVFYSLFQIGVLYLEHLHDEREGIRYALRAYAFHPKRVESMHTIVNYYCRRYKDYATAFRFLDKIKDTPLPEEDGLFVSVVLYQHLVRFLYYAVSFLTFRRIPPTIPEPEWERFPAGARSSLEDCRVLQDLEILSDAFVPRALPFPPGMIPVNPDPVNPAHRHYRTLNPCIARRGDDGSIWYNVRCTNFDVHYQSMNKDGLIHTYNFICNHDFSRVYRSEDVSEYRQKKCDPKATIRGYEDMRLFWYQGRWRFIANNDELSSSLNRPQMVLGCYAEYPDDERGVWRIEHVVHLQYPYQSNVEKNWTPIVPDNMTTTREPLRIIYSIRPLVILEPDIATGFCRIAHNLDYRYRLGGVPTENAMLRGSTPWIPYHQGWLTIGHYVYFLEPVDYQRVYYHFFVYVDRALQVMKFSKPFHFEKHNIEFATGLLLDKDRDRVIVTYSVSDSEIRSMELPCKEVENRLASI